MIPINNNKFTKLSSNKNILFFDILDNSMIKGYLPDVEKEEIITLVKLISKNKQDIKEFEVFQKKLTNEGKTVIIVEDK